MVKETTSAHPNRYSWEKPGTTLLALERVCIESLVLELPHSACYACKPDTSQFPKLQIAPLADEYNQSKRVLFTLRPKSVMSSTHLRSAHTRVTRAQATHYSCRLPPLLCVWRQLAWPGQATTIYMPTTTGNTERTSLLGSSPPTRRSPTPATQLETERLGSLKWLLSRELGQTTSPPAPSRGAGALGRDSSSGGGRRSRAALVRRSASADIDNPAPLESRSRGLFSSASGAAASESRYGAPYNSSTTTTVL